MTDLPQDTPKPTVIGRITLSAEAEVIKAADVEAEEKTEGDEEEDQP